MMFKVSVLAVMLLGLLVGRGAADTSSLRGARALDSDDGARALADSEDEDPSNWDERRGRDRKSRDPCSFAKKSGGLDLNCYKLVARGKYCRISPLEEEKQTCSQVGYGVEKCTKNICSKPGRRTRYRKKCGTSVFAHDGLICKAPSYTVGNKLEKCETPSVCNTKGECLPCTTSTPPK